MSLLKDFCSSAIYRVFERQVRQQALDVHPGVFLLLETVGLRSPDRHRPSVHRGNVKGPFCVHRCGTVGVGIGRARTLRPRSRALQSFQNHHLNCNSRPEGAACDVLISWTHVQQSLDDSEDGGARAVAMVYVYVIACSEMLRRQAHGTLNPGDDGGSARM